MPDWKTTRSGGRCRGVCRRTASVLLAALGERAGEAGNGTISRRLGELAGLLAVDDAVLEFETRRRAVAAQAAADGTIPFYAEGHDDLVERAANLARRSPLPSWALAAAKEVLDQAEACTERRAAIVALHDDAAGLLAERSESGETRPRGWQVQVHPTHGTGGLCRLVGALRGGGQRLARRE